MIRVVGDQPAIVRDIVSLAQGAGGENAAAGLPDDDQPMPSLFLAYGTSAIRRVAEHLDRRGEPFHPVIGLVDSMSGAEEARALGATEVVFYPTGREELVFRAVKVMGDSVFRLGDGVSARHMLRFLLAWSKRNGVPFGVLKVSCVQPGVAVGRDVALDLMINLRMSDHIFRLSSGDLLVLMPQSTRESAQIAVERLRLKVLPAADCELRISHDGGEFSDITAEDLLERL